MKFHEKRILNYPAQDLYALVADVKSYPNFLPWCLDSKILEKTDQFMVADLVIGYGIFRDSFRSHVHLTPSQKIEIEYKQGPFKHLKNFWTFTSLGPSKTEVEFFIEFQFKSKILEKMISKVFDQGIERLVGAFEKQLLLKNR